MVEVYHWEGDLKAEQFIVELDRRGLEYRLTQLDPEAGGGETCVRMSGKTYWSIEEALAALETR